MTRSFPPPLLSRSQRNVSRPTERSASLRPSIDQTLPLGQAPGVERRQAPKRSAARRRPRTAPRMCVLRAEARGPSVAPRYSCLLYDSSTRFVTGPRTAAAKARVARFGGRDVRDPQPEGHSTPRTASGCVVCFENRQHAAGTRRVHQPAHERARAGTRDTPRRHDLQQKRDRECPAMSPSTAPKPPW
jgi:hypothetical protein